MTTPPTPSKEIAVKLNDTTLRAIGQDLEAADLFDFDLELEGQACVVHGTVMSAPPEPPPPPRGLKGLWKRFQKRESDLPPEPVPVPLERTYLADDIDRLVAEGQSRRGERGGASNPKDKPDLYSTREMLRVFAAYCETADLELLSVSKREGRLKYEFMTKSGVRGEEERAFSDLADFAYGLSLKRS